ncbi:MAG: AraC family ligand binding domain-containing protein [Dehalococcoidia bacterium]|jgi:quercetin dioxygenase-like cupin family protein|nr:AraC family ligand binding domain-containing protein [Dehalococcoidia bacterium]MDW8008138.1 AraC family ligand binding domain-containing protein [Chloroflexota bacterium]
MDAARLTPWQRPEGPSREELEDAFRREGLSPRWWSNGPGERYAVHSHPYHKVLYCYRGSIRFGLADGRGAVFELRPGDRLDLPPGTPHWALVGPEGVICVEAPRE